MDGVQVNNGINGVQRPVLPRLDLVQDGISHPGDQRRRHLNLVDLFEVILELPGRHAAGVQRQNLIIEALQTDLAFAHQLGLEVAFAIAWNFDIQITVGANDPLAGLAVARVAGAAPIWGVLLVAQVFGHLGLEGRLKQPLLELLEQARVLEQLFGSGVLG